jgi:hypothetical protein
MTFEPDSPVVAELLERYTPVPHAQPQWSEVEKRSRAWTYRLVLVAVVALVVAAPALALSSTVRDLVGLGHPEPVVEQARWLLSAPVGNGFWVHAWTAPSSTGGRCDFMTTDQRPVAKPPSDANGATICSSGGGSERLSQARPEYPLSLGLSITRRPKAGDPTKWVPPIVSGAILPRLKATRVEVVWNDGSLPLRLRDNYFLGGSPLLYMPPFERFPFTVVAYDAQGDKVAEKRLESPSLRLMNGWKEYTRAYKQWQREQRR